MVCKNSMKFNIIHTSFEGHYKRKRGVFEINKVLLFSTTLFLYFLYVDASSSDTEQARKVFNRPAQN